MTTKEHEQTLNVRLSDELKFRGLNAKPEVIHPKNRRIDVEVRIGPARIAVEAEHGQSSAKRREAIRDADKRLPENEDLADIAVAVCYPDDSTRESLPSAELIWTICEGGGGNASWTSGNLDQLTSVIRLAPAQLGDPDFAAAALSNSLDAAVRRLDDDQKEDLARALDLPKQDKLNNKKVREPWNAPAKRALLVVATAVMFHSRLDLHLGGMRPDLDRRIDPPQPFAGDWPPLKAQFCADGSNPIGDFADAWNLILALDYKPIFETGRAALLSCSPDPAFAGAISDTAKAALAVSGNIAGMRHDLLGRIFHTVLDSARYDGSYYTTTAAATLLAALAIKEDMCDWSDPEAIGKLRITDPACGTGTLLMAAAERIRELAPQADTESDLARSLIEQVFSGYDVNLTATHMAATTLGLLSPTTQFRNMKIGRTLLGLDKNGNARLGSLEFLGNSQPMLIPFPNAEPTARQVETGEETARAEPADVVIMNPPYTRDSLRYDQFDQATELIIKEREMALLKNTPVHLSHSGGAFTYLADFLVKKESGAIAAVLAMVGATNYSTMKLRRALAQTFHVETIVTSHDPMRIYFSENTDIGEMLVIFRRWPDGKGPKPHTAVINLARNPATPAEAKTVAWAIDSGRVASQNYGTVQNWPESRIAAGNWGAVQFLSPYLCEQFVGLLEGRFFPSLSLGSIAKIGPAGQRIRDAFTRSTMPDKQGMVALWQHDTSVTQSMAAKPDTHILAKPPPKAHLAESYWQQRGTLMLPQRMRLNTVRTFCAKLDTPALGSLWVPCCFTGTELGSEILEKAVCVFLNSSVGALVLLGDRTNKAPSYPHFSLDDLRKLIVPNFAAIGESAVAKLSATYDAHATDVLLPLPQMDPDPVRRALDDSVCDALGLDSERVAAIRRNLAAEPSVTGKRYAGLRPT